MHSFQGILHMGCGFRLIVYQPQVETCMKKKTSKNFKRYGDGDISITSTLSRITSLPFNKIRWPRIMTSLTTKLHVS